MTTLYLLRHAEAGAAASGGDRERTLTARGERMALVTGQFLRQEGMRLDVVLCSTARRARQTWEMVADRLDYEPEVISSDAIYRADAEGLLEQIRGLDPDMPHAMVVGHNPAMHQLAFSLAREAAGDALERLARDLPPAGLAALEFASNGWHLAAPHRGRLVRFVTPAMLV